MSPLETLTLYSNAPNNLLGTALFLSYILLALVLSSQTILSLHRQYRSISQSQYQNAPNVKLLVFFSFVSFSTLSYHMLKFLLHSYLRWRLNKTMFKPDERMGLWGSLWSWMLESELFTDFAKELVQDGPSMLWTQIALLGTWFWEVWMAGKAKEENLTSAEMLKFIGLGQILPISFTATLFLLHLQLRAPSQEESASKESTTTTTTTPAPVTPARGFRVSLTLSTILFHALIPFLPLFSLLDSAYFIPSVLATRFVLLFPHLGITGLGSQEEWKSSTTISLTAVVSTAGLFLRENTVRELILRIWDGGEAVKALGWDAVIGGAIAGWMASGG